MTVGRDAFIDPSTGYTYEWPINHSEEEQSGKTRKMEHLANTAGTARTSQQGDDSPMLLRWTGTIMTAAQLLTFWQFFGLCSSRTIHVRDFTGDVYEVIITSFTPQRLRTVRNNRDPALAPLHYWKYTMEMEIVSFVSGLMNASGVAP